MADEPPRLVRSASGVQNRVYASSNNRCGTGTGLAKARGLFYGLAKFHVDENSVGGRNLGRRFQLRLTTNKREAFPSSNMKSRTFD
jgi:hypothetical protein